MNEILIARADDWAAVYVDGVRVDQGNYSSDPTWVLKCAKIPHRQVWAQDQADKLGEFPALASEVVEDYE